MKNKTPISVAPLITEAERVIAECIKHFGLKTKPENILFTVQTKGRKNALGWFWANRWKTGKKEAIHEINLSAETLQDCNPGEVIIHEMAHAENKTLDIRDCANQVHNKHFKTMAERLGLEVKPRDRRYGYGFTDLAQPAKDFLKAIKFNAEVFKLQRITSGTVAKAGTRLLKLECPSCGWTCRSTQKWIDTGLPTCACGKKLEES